MEKRIKWVLEWTYNGKRLTKEYHSEAIALICYNECKSVKTHSDVVLTKVTSQVIETTEKPRKVLRTFARIQFRNDASMQDKFYELTDPEQIVLFKSCLTDADVFSVTFQVSREIPNYIRRNGFTVISK